MVLVKCINTYYVGTFKVRKFVSVISVITPTIRKEGLEIVRKSLAKQTFRDFEWIIGAPFDPEIPEAKFVCDDFADGFWSLNRIHNKLFKVTRGELVVSYQDWIWTSPSALQSLWDAYKATGGCVSGVGDQYDQLDEYGRPTNKVWDDPRKREGLGLYECNWEDCEWNFAATPREAIFKVGGMDERLDFLGFGGDQFQLCERMDAMGVKFYLDQNNETRTLRHGRERKDWDDNHVLFNGSYEKRKEELIKSGQWPQLPYLD